MKQDCTFLQGTAALVAACSFITSLSLLAADQSAASKGSGQFQPSWNSLEKYQCPDWFRDAKFGIFMHWGIPSVPDETRTFGTGWYACGMYLQHGEGAPSHCRLIYDWHLQRYGHPTQFRYQDFIPMWKAEKWDPEALAAFYKKIGAKYLVAMAVHHDNFDMYDSTWNRWNSVKMGPRRDILREWKHAAESQGLRFGASSHLQPALGFIKGAWGSDRSGPLKGVPYVPDDSPDKDFYLKGVTQEQFQLMWYRRTLEIIDNYAPDLVFFDTGGLDVGNYGLKVAAHFYNTNAARHNGRCEAVINVKRNYSAPNAVVVDIERGQSDSLRPDPWQTDTTLVNGWFYHKAPLMLTPAVVIGNLADIVSKNGNLLLNVALRPDGTLPDDQRAVLEQLGAWLATNGEAIYGSRPWVIYGEGPTSIKGGRFQEQSTPYTGQDIRFTTKGDFLYATVMAWPSGGSVVIRSLAAGAASAKGGISEVRLLGSTIPLDWKRDRTGLIVTLPAEKSREPALVLRVGGLLGKR